MKQEEFNALMNKENDEAKNCLVGLTREDQVTALLIVINTQARELGKLPYLSAKELMGMCCDERKSGDTEGILNAVEKVLGVHEKYRNLRLDLLQD